MACEECGSDFWMDERLVGGQCPPCRGRSLWQEMVDADTALRFPDPPHDGDVLIERYPDDSGVGSVSANIPLSVIEHSPTGWSFGYPGSGPADLALNILNAFIPPGFDGDEAVPLMQGAVSSLALVLYQDFKRDFIEPLASDRNTLLAVEIRRWIGDSDPDSYAIVDRFRACLLDSDTARR